MSLSTQLARGNLALLMLALCALLALAAGRRAEAESAQVAEQAVGMEINAPSCSLPPRHVLLLAQAPADLGQLANRVGHSCRA